MPTLQKIALDINKLHKLSIFFKTVVEITFIPAVKTRG